MPVTMYQCCSFRPSYLYARNEKRERNCLPAFIVRCWNNRVVQWRDRVLFKSLSSGIRRPRVNTGYKSPMSIMACMYKNIVYSTKHRTLYHCRWRKSLPIYDYSRYLPSDQCFGLSTALLSPLYQKFSWHAKIDACPCACLWKCSLREGRVLPIVFICVGAEP